MTLKRRDALALSLSAALVPAARAQEAGPLKIGLILPMTGPFQSTGRQVEAGARLYLQLHPKTEQGRAVEIVLRDDASVPDTTRRAAQELAANDKVAVLMGFGLTPLALAAAPIATRFKLPMIVTSAATASITEASPFVIRASVTLPQISVAAADWAARAGIKTAVTLVTDYGPGIDAETWFNTGFKQAGGAILGSLRVPLQNPDFAPFLQRARDLAPEAIYVFIPSGPGAAFMRQYAERGMAQTGIRLFGEGDMTDDDVVNDMGEIAVGIVTAHYYSAAHDSAENRAFVDAFGKATGGRRPNTMGVGGYDAMDMVYRALAKTGGNADGIALVDAMKGMSFESPRGPVTIDPATRELTQNIYMRKVERRDGQLWNIETETFRAMKDPAKERR